MKLLLNVGKNKLVIFHKKQKHILKLNDSIESNNSECVSSFNFIGIMFDEGLSWINHMNSIKKIVSMVINFIDWN